MKDHYGFTKKVETFRGTLRQLTQHMMVINESANMITEASQVFPLVCNGIPTMSPQKPGEPVYEALVYYKVKEDIPLLTSNTITSKDAETTTKVSEKKDNQIIFDI